MLLGFMCEADAHALSKKVAIPAVTLGLHLWHLCRECQLTGAI